MKKKNQKRPGSKNLEIMIGEEFLTEEFIKSQLTKRKIIKEWAYVLHDKDVINVNEPDMVEEEAIRRIYRDVKKGEIAENVAFINENKDINKNLLEDYKKIVLENPKKWSHWHILIHTPDNYLYCDELAKMFDIPVNFVRVKKTGRGNLLRNTLLDCVEYMTHEDAKQQELGKVLYPDEAIKCSFNFRAELTARTEEKMEYGKNLTPKEKLRMAVLRDGKTLKQAMEDDPILFAEDYSTLTKMRGLFLQQQTPPPFRLNLYIEGSGGVGKDLMAKSIARSMYPDILDLNEVIFEIGADGVSFDGYDGQPVIIWADVRAGALIGKFGRENVLGGLLEPFQGEIKRKQNVKYSSISLVNAVNIFTGADPWTDFLNGLVGEYTDRSGRVFKSENKAQSYRRFPLIIPVSQSDFDIMLNEGFMQDNNNWTQYFVYKNISGNFAKANALLSGNEQKIREIEDKMSSHVMGAVEEIQEKTKRKELTDEEIQAIFGGYGEAKTGTEIEAEREAEKEAKRKAEEQRKLEELQRQYEAQRFGTKTESEDDILPF